jgi:membrane protein
MNKSPIVLKLFIKAFKDYTRDRAKIYASSIAYYQLLSIGPLVAFVIFISYKVLGASSVHDEVIPLLKSVFSPQLTKVIIYFLSTDKGLKEDDLNTLSVISGLLFLWAGKGYFSVIKQTIQIVWNKRQVNFGIKATLHRDYESIKIALVSVTIILIAIFIRILLPHPHNWDDTLQPANPFLQKLSEWVVAIVLICMLRIFYFTYIPPVKIKWKYTLPGALMGAILFLIGREIMAIHFSKRPQADATESILMVMLWFYYSGLVFIYSAEFTKLYVAHKQNIDLKSLHFDVK